MTSLINFRPLCNNKYTKTNFIFRSGTSYHFTAEDADYLYTNHFRYFINLRSKKETLENESLIMYLANSGIRWIDFGIDNENDYHIIQSPTPENYAYYYMGILEHGAKSIHDFLAFIANMPTAIPIVYGCSLGKDRTGIVSYILLKIFESTNIDIYADFVETKKHLLTNREICDYFNKKNCVDYKLRCNTRCETLKIFEQLVQIKYLSIENYLYTIGITQYDIKNIKTKWGI